MSLLLALALFAPGGIERAAENGAQASFTPNGRLLVYVQNDPKGVADVFVLDRRSGRRERVSVGSRGQRGKGASIEPSIGQRPLRRLLLERAELRAQRPAPPRRPRAQPALLP
jgi:hypothetical protein